MVDSNEFKVRASSIGTFLDCQRKFYYAQVLGIKSPPGIAATAGTAYHAGLEKNFKQKVETHEDIHVDDCLEEVNRSFNEGIKETKINERFDDPETERGRVLGLCELFHKTKAPKIQPAVVEGYMETNLANGVGLTGHVDLIDVNGRIIDHKTSKMKIDISKKVGYQLQAVSYYLLSIAAGYEVDTGTEFLVAVKTKDPKIQKAGYRISKYDINYYMTIVSSIKLMVESEQFFVPNRTSFLCSRRFCGYANRCEEECGGKVRYA